MTDIGHTNTPMLKGQIIALGLCRKLQDKTGSREVNFSTTDAFKVRNEKEMVFGRQDREIATVSGHMG